MFQYELILRKVAKDDIKKLFDLKIETVNNHHRTVIINESDQERWFESIDRNTQFPASVFLIGSDGREDVGVIAISDINYISRNGNVSCDIFPRFRGKGYGTKLIQSGIRFAKEVLNMHKLCCEILDYNVASKKMVEKNGFVQEGLKKQQVFKNGSYVDSVVYGLII